jgi:hypothetical protein
VRERAFDLTHRAANGSVVGNNTRGYQRVYVSSYAPGERGDDRDRGLQSSVRETGVDRTSQVVVRR